MNRIVFIDIARAGPGLGSKEEYSILQVLINFGGIENDM